MLMEIFQNMNISFMPAQSQDICILENTNRGEIAKN